MRISLDVLTKAIQKVGVLAESSMVGNNNVVNFLMDIKGEQVDICYADNKKAIIEKIKVLVEDGDIDGKVVLAYKNFKNIIDACQSYGDIEADEVQLVFDSEKRQVGIKANKFMRVGRKTGEKGSDGEDIVEEVRKLVSSVNQSIVYNYPEDSMKYSILTRVDYSKFFVDADGGVDGFDEWGKVEFTDILMRASHEKNRTLYVSGQTGSVFMNGMLSAMHIKLDTIRDTLISNGFSINTNMTKDIANIISKVDSDNVYVCSKESRYVVIKDKDETVGLWFEMAPANRVDLTTVNIYTEMEFNSVDVIVSKSALGNIINNIKKFTNEEKLVAEFKEVEGNKSISMQASTGGQSISGAFSAILEGKISDEDWEKMLDIKVDAIISVFMTFLKDCSTNYVNISLEVLADGKKIVRIAEALRRDGDKVVLGMKYYYTAGK